MTDADLVRLSDAYLDAIDARDPDAMADCLTEDCVLTIETHGITHEGRAAICSLFATRWDGPLRARHHDRTHIPHAASGRIASQFTVTYSGPDAPEPKSNANVLTARDGKIARLQVYMAGANTVKS